MNVMELSARLSLDAKGFEKGIKSAESGFKSFGSRLSAIGGKIMAGLAAGTAAMATGFTVIGKKAVSAYADYEQLVGGVETLFKTSADTVQKYADQAYKTAGVSANRYMEMTTSFAASLISSLNGDTAQAADLANMAIIDMSDNANKMGTDITAIQNAYQGFAKQNYTMLDNLKLGYGGTKTEMERLLKKADDINKKNGKNTQYTIKNFSDIVEAIHVVQTEMDITGTTAKEASTTISGSLNMVKSAWQDMLVAMADPDENPMKIFGNIQDETTATAKTMPTKTQQATRRLVESVKTMLGNVLPVVRNFVNGFGDVITEIAPIIGEELPKLIAEFLPKLIEAGGNLITGIGKGIKTAAETLAPQLPGMIQSVLEGALSLIRDLGNTIINIINEAFGVEIPPIDTSFVQGAFQWFVDNKDTIIGAVTGIIGAFAVGKIISFAASLNPLSIAFGLVAAAIGVVAANWDKIKDWIGKAWHTTVTWVQEKWSDVKSAFDKAGEWAGKAWDATINWVQNKWEAVSNAFSAAGEWVSNKAHDITIAWTSTVDSWFDTIKGWLSGTELGSIVLNFASAISEWIQRVWDWMHGKNLSEIGLSIGATVGAWLDTVKGWLDGTATTGFTLNIGATVSGWIEKILDWIENGVNIAVNFFGGIQPTQGTFTDTEGTVYPDPMGVFQHNAKGNWNVPYDNMPALLHRNEMVLTATQARQYREGRGNSLDAASLAQAMRSAVLDLTMELNGETVGRVFGDQTTRRVNHNISQINRRHRYGYGG